jgi:hypothetical protein
MHGTESEGRGPAGFVNLGTTTTTTTTIGNIVKCTIVISSLRVWTSAPVVNKRNSNCEAEGSDSRASPSSRQSGAETQADILAPRRVVSPAMTIAKALTAPHHSLTADKACPLPVRGKCHFHGFGLFARSLHPCLFAINQDGNTRHLLPLAEDTRPAPAQGRHPTRASDDVQLASQLQAVTAL